MLTSPQIVNVSFAGDPLESDIDAFAQAMTTTSYWADRTAEYGIATPTIGGKTNLAASTAFRIIE